MLGTIRASGQAGWCRIPRRQWNRSGEDKRFHEFVLSGNEESLRQYYEAKRRSPILGSEAFIERVRQPGAPATQEHPGPGSAGPGSVSDLPKSTNFLSHHADSRF